MKASGGRAYKHDSRVVIQNEPVVPAEKLRSHPGQEEMLEGLLMDFHDLGQIARVRLADCAVPPIAGDVVLTSQRSFHIPPPFGRHRSWGAPETSGFCPRAASACSGHFSSSRSK